MPIEFSDLTLAHAPWSMSKAGLASNCSFAFDLKYVRRVRGKTPPRSSAGAIGRAVHQVLEALLKGAPISEMKNEIFRAVIDEKLTTPEIEDVMGFSHNIKSFIKRLDTYKEKHAIDDANTVVEGKFCFTKDFLPAKYMSSAAFFRGVWDVVMLAGDRAIILDHKSGDMGNPDKVLDRYDNQRRFYAIAAMNRFPGIKAVHTAFHYVQSEEIIWAKEADTAGRINNEYIPWYKDYLNRCSAEITAKIPRKGWHCSFCNFTHICPLVKK